jgi:hypothetical protein
MKRMNSIEELKQEKEIPVIMADDQGFVVYINHAFTNIY